MNPIPDDPIISRMERTGYAVEYKCPHCPVCGKETDTFYKDKNGEIVGCDECICRIDAWDYLEDY